MTEEQLSKLDKCYYKFELGQNCVEEVLPARQLLGSNRFDLYAILLYINQKVLDFTDMSYAEEVYKERTRAITGCTFSETGNSNKGTFKAFLSTLDNLIEAFQKDEYDYNKTLVPIDKNGVLMDGAHRVACAAYFNRDIKVLRFVDVENDRMTVDHLRKNFLPEKIADAMALEAMNWHYDLYMVIFWPKACAQDKEKEKAIELLKSAVDVEYDKQLNMSYNAIRNLMIQIYGHMDWLGDISNDFESTYIKADQVWDNCGKCHFFIVHANSCQYVLDLKSKMRDIFNIGLASIHTTDTMRETMMAANAILNENSYHFITTAKPTNYKKSYKIFELFKNKLIENHKDLNDFIIDSGMILALYGVRESTDLDYYCLKEEDSKIFDSESCIDNHNLNTTFYSVPVREIILSPSNFFMFNEIKFVSLLRLAEFKKQRQKHQPKDIEDIKLINILLENSTKNKWEKKWQLLEVSFLRRKRRLVIFYREQRNAFLKKIGLYAFLKSLLRK